MQNQLSSSASSQPGFPGTGQPSAKEGDAKESTPPSFPVIVIGASAGGMEVIKKLLANLPPGFEAAVLIVWHMASDMMGAMSVNLNNHSTLPVTTARDGETIEKAHIYFAAVDHHLLVENNRLRITKGPKENRFRPAVDPLFRSAAYELGSRAIGVILSGALDDGSSGLWMIRNRGGITVVQSPDDAEVRSMPESAIRQVEVDHIVTADQLSPLLQMLVKEHQPQPALPMPQQSEREEIELHIAKDDEQLNGDVFKLGELTRFTCPECHGVLTAITEGNTRRFRCHTGHAFTTDSLVSALNDYIENSLWTAVRSIRESSMLLNFIGDHYAATNNAKVAALYFKKAQEAGNRASQVREVTAQHSALNADIIKEAASGGN